jgi:hypothetical protein
VELAWGTGYVTHGVAPWFTHDFKIHTKWSEQ